MNRFFFAFLSLFFISSIRAQSAFEGQLTITYQVEKQEPVVAVLSLKGNEVYIKQTQHGNPKYDGYVLNLATKDFYTISTPDKKVIIKYNYEQLVDFYEANQLKDGYRKSYEINYKATDKTKEENGVKMTKVTGENELLKVSAWTAETNIPLNSLIPLLRLMGNWNEADGTGTVVMEAEVTNKASKKESTVKVNLRKGPIAKDTFKLPKGYLTKDFAKLMEQEKGNGKLAVLVQTFAAF